MEDEMNEMPEEVIEEYVDFPFQADNWQEPSFF